MLSYKFQFICLSLYLLNYFGRYTAEYCIGLYVFGHYCTSSHYGSITNSYACKHGGIGSNPDILANVDGSIAHALTLGWGKVVVESGQHDIVADESALVKGDAALILKLAAHVDEYPFTNDGVFTAVCMERREHAYRLRNLTFPKLLQESVKFLAVVVIVINSMYVDKTMRTILFDF